MRPRSHRRQVLLFLAAVVVPCLVLVALGVRMIRQERELAEKRRIEERQRRRSQTAQEALARLERLKLQESAALGAGAARPQHPAVRLVARVENNRLVLPWEASGAGRDAQRALAEGEFAARIQAAEREELVSRQLERAAAAYRQALEAARRPAQAGHARLLLARVLTKLGNRAEALTHYKQILATPPEITDEQGVPLRLYAAGRLLEAGADPAVVGEQIRKEAGSPRWPTPAEAYLWRDLAEKLADADLAARIAQRIKLLEQALALAREFPRLAALHGPEPAWMFHVEHGWLVGVAPSIGGLPTAAVAVDAQEILTALDARADPKGEPLGENFPGLRVALPEATPADGAARPFYLAALALVLGLTLFGAYLVWRDVRRDLRMAELRSQFVSSVSHELKTPLTAIRMFAETLRLGRSGDPQAQEEYLETIVNESERLTRLVDNVLDFSKIEQGKKIYHAESTALEEVVSAAARAMHYPLAQQGFQLRVEVEEGVPAVRADRDAIEQAILNLLTNAMKYSGQAREIDLRLHRSNGRAVIQVTDRGVGIAPEEQGRIFEKFYRVPTRENELVPGTGLGLTLVAHTAKAHGGEVRVSSAPGQGSTFSIEFPLENGT